MQTSLGHLHGVLLCLDGSLQVANVTLGAGDLDAHLDKNDGGEVVRLERNIEYIIINSIVIIYIVFE